MKRSNGYLELNFTEGYNTLITKKIIRPVKRNKTSFYIDEFNLFFKETESSYLEVIGSIISHELKIDSVEYDMLVFTTNDVHYKGVISENFCKSGYNLVKFADIISEYLEATKEKVNFNDMNLELITKAINYRYREYPNKDRIINSIIDSLKKYFLFDILLGNIDNGKYNYEVLENTKDAKMTPYYDYGQIFKFKSTRLTVTDSGNFDIYDNLFEFLSKESAYFLIFKSMYEILNPDKLLEIFSLCENKTNSKMSDNDKNIFFLAYSRHYQFLGEVINKINKTK